MFLAFWKNLNKLSCSLEKICLVRRILGLQIYELKQILHELGRLQKVENQKPWSSPYVIQMGKNGSWWIFKRWDIELEILDDFFLSMSKLLSGGGR